MSNLHIIVSQKIIDFLPKERYLKFTKYTDNENLFVYMRYEHSLGMVNLITNNQYEISERGQYLIKKILSNQDYVYWSTIQLTNHMGEEDAVSICLKNIKNKEFIKISGMSNIKFNINSLYYLISN